MFVPVWDTLVGKSGLGALRCRRLCRLLADDAVAVPVPHVAVGRVAPGNRCDAVAPCLGARDPAVPVVVVQPERVGAAGCSCRSWVFVLRGVAGTVPPGAMSMSVSAQYARVRARASRSRRVYGQAVGPFHVDDPCLRTSSGSSAAASRRRRGRASDCGSRSAPRASGSAGPRRTASGSLGRPCRARCRAPRTGPRCARCRSRASTRTSVRCTARRFRRDCGRCGPRPTGCTCSRRCRTGCTASSGATTEAVPCSGLRSVPGSGAASAAVSTASTPDGGGGCGVSGDPGSGRLHRVVGLRPSSHPVVGRVSRGSVFSACSGLQRFVVESRKPLPDLRSS